VGDEIAIRLCQVLEYQQFVKRLIAQAASGWKILRMTTAG
jgi:hypothetical protein